MPNHFHIALRTGAVPLSRSMRSIQQMVTRGFIARHRVFGPLWQGRYKAKLVAEERYLDGLLACIHLNPVTAGMVEDAADHPWSGHREIIGRIRHPGVDVDEVRMLFGETPRSARRAYVRAIKGTVVEPWAGEGHGRLPWWKLGRPAAAEGEGPEPDRTVAFVDELGRSTGLERLPIGPDDFVGKGAAFLGVQIEDLAGRGRGQEVVQAGEILATLGVERYRLRVKDIEAEFNKSPEAGSRMVSRGSEKRRKDESFRGRLEAQDRVFAGRGSARRK